MHAITIPGVEKMIRMPCSKNAWPMKLLRGP